MYMTSHSSHDKSEDNFVHKTPASAYKEKWDEWPKFS